jgi:hypothetical protein
MSLTGPHSLLADLARLEGLRDPARSAGQRQFQRFVVRGDAELHSMDRNGDSAVLAIQVRDLGRGGMGFVSQQELDVNSTWRACFLHRGYVFGQQALIVRHCSEVQRGVYLIGSQFCIESGLMCLLGIDPTAIREGDGPTGVAQPPRFLSPGEVA